MRRLIDGLSGWLAYRQAAAAKKMYSEHFLYDPISEIAKSRGWLVLPQQPIKRKLNSAGAPKTIDFAFVRKRTDDHGPGMVLLEVKYLKNANSTLELRRLQEDINKLSTTFPTHLDDLLNVAQYGKAKNFLLVAAQRENYRALLSVNSKTNSSVVMMLKKALADNPPKSVYRTEIQTHLRDDQRWEVVCFGQTAW